MQIIHLPRCWHISHVQAANPDKPAKKPWDDYHVPFDGTTTNRADFTDKGLGPRPDPRKQDKALTLPFNGSTTYRCVRAEICLHGWCMYGLGFVDAFLDSQCLSRVQWG